MPAVPAAWLAGEQRAARHLRLAVSFNPQCGRAPKLASHFQLKEKHDECHHPKPMHVHQLPRPKLRLRLPEYPGTTGRLECRLYLRPAVQVRAWMHLHGEVRIAAAGWGWMQPLPVLGWPQAQLVVLGIGPWKGRLSMEETGGPMPRSDAIARHPALTPERRFDSLAPALRGDKAASASMPVMPVMPETL